MGTGLRGWTAEERLGSRRGGIPPPSEAAESREEPQPEEASPSEGRFLQWLGHRGHGERFRGKREAEVRAKSGRIRHMRAAVEERGREMLARDAGTGTPCGLRPSSQSSRGSFHGHFFLSKLIKPIPVKRQRGLSLNYRDARLQRRARVTC